jgi:hypothetical protein
MMYDLIVDDVFIGMFDTLHEVMLEAELSLNNGAKQIRIVTHNTSEEEAE